MHPRTQQDGLLARLYGDVRGLMSAYDRYGDWMRGIVGPSAVEQMGALTRAMTEGWQRGERGLPEGAGDVAGMLDFTSPIGGLAGVIWRLPLDDLADLRYNSLPSGRASDAYDSRNPAGDGRGSSAASEGRTPDRVGGVRLSGQEPGAADPIVVGERAPSGGDIPLSLEEARHVAEQVSILDPAVPVREMRGATGRVYSRRSPAQYDPHGREIGPGHPDWVEPDPRPNMDISRQLRPATELQTYRHELGHVGQIYGHVQDRATRAIEAMPANERQALLSDLRRVSQIEREDFWTRGANPRERGEGVGYAGRTEELHADAQARYSADPASLKRDFPRVAQFVRDIWNSQPDLARHMTFNEFAAAMIGGGLLASTLGGEGGG